VNADSLHDDAPHSLSTRLIVAILVIVVSVPVLGLALWTAREALKPLTERSDVQVFSLTFLSIVFEALPFILVGALLSGLLEMFVSRRRMLQLIPRSRFAQLLVGATMGVCLPVCECGVVVVLRRLLKKGMPLGMALAYLLVAPIVNPVVIASTFAAFRGKPEWLFMPLARVGFGIAIGVAVAALVGRGRAREWIKPDAREDDTQDADPHASLGPGQKVSAACDHAVSEFLGVIPFLIAGALIAAAIQTALPRTAMNAVSGNPVLSVLGMMALAVGLNLCSEADAFVAAGLLSFTAVAKLAFLVLGPMFDIKLLVMYGSVFRRSLIWRLVAAILVAVFVVMALLAFAERLWFGG